MIRGDSGQGSCHQNPGGQKGCGRADWMIPKALDPRECGICCVSGAWFSFSRGLATARSLPGSSRRALDYISHTALLQAAVLYYGVSGRKSPSRSAPLGRLALLLQLYLSPGEMIGVLLLLFFLPLLLYIAAPQIRSVLMYCLLLRSIRGRH